MRLNMRCHEVEEGKWRERERERRDRPDPSPALVLLVQWTSNSSAGSRRGKDGKSGNRLFVQMKRENQNPRCNPSFQTAIFFCRSRSLALRMRTFCLSLSSSFLLSFILFRIIQPPAHSRRLLRPVCLRKVDASPNPKF